MPICSDVFRVPPGYNAPQQVHITQGDHVGKGVIVSWVTPDEPGSSRMLYWSKNSQLKNTAEGIVLTYKYVNYTSGDIHHCTIDNLELNTELWFSTPLFDTKYFYEVGIGNTTRKFWFRTPPNVGPDVPSTFGVIGDLGQTQDSNRTLAHYELNTLKGQTVLFVVDLSYANDYSFHDNTRWDTWERFLERNAAYQPWIWTAGNHELDFAPELGESEPFKPYRSRFHVRYKASISSSPLWYSIKRASAHIIVLSSYSAFGKSTPQYKWLRKELPKVNREETLWLVLVHCPLYSSYVDHYTEGESMRVVYESWFVEYKVDVVFSGHVHAYERSERISNIAYNIVNGICTPKSDQSAPVYVTIGDGGNLKRTGDRACLLNIDYWSVLLADVFFFFIFYFFLFWWSCSMIEPQPSYSAYREASFGHGIFDIKKRSHAFFSWHRNQDGYDVEADCIWLHNRYWNSSSPGEASRSRNKCSISEEEVSQSQISSYS
ncbi:Acid phosphatase [Parasponia andersonii]|uniref:Purple acid phosphatase n=1 Tax=Parasponia andersonii TaxID=3476 RepID=A0A2P5BT78_PARAD|nr:Acid phosphatase [Parasponia andersonii]